MNPFAILLILFLMVPVIEIYLLIKVGGIIGAMPTIILVVFTAVLGAWLLRIQGFSTLQRVKNTLEAGGIPAFELVEGLILLIAGALLLTPGFFTDAIGFMCLVPALRRLFLVWVSSKFMMPGAGSSASEQFSQQQTRRESQTQSTKPSQRRVPPHAGQRHPTTKKHTVIEGEFQREDGDSKK